MATDKELGIETGMPGTSTQLAAPAMQVLVQLQDAEGKVTTTKVNLVGITSDFGAHVTINSLQNIVDTIAGFVQAASYGQVMRAWIQVEEFYSYIKPKTMPAGAMSSAEDKAFLEYITADGITVKMMLPMPHNGVIGDGSDATLFLGDHKTINPAAPDVVGISSIFTAGVVATEGTDNYTFVGGTPQGTVVSTYVKGYALSKKSTGFRRPGISTEIGGE